MPQAAAESVDDVPADALGFGRHTNLGGLAARSLAFGNLDPSRSCKGLDKGFALGCLDAADDRRPMACKGPFRWRKQSHPSEHCQRLGKIEGIGSATATALITALAIETASRTAVSGLVPRQRFS